METSQQMQTFNCWVTVPVYNQKDQRVVSVFAFLHLYFCSPWSYDKAHQWS